MARESVYREVAGGAIFVVAMVAVLTRPRRLGEATAAALGGLAMIVAGVARLAEERGCALAVVGARVDRRDEPPGPHSVGHTARVRT